VPHIDLTRTHDLGRDGARRVAEEVAADLRAHLGARTYWEGDALRLDGPGVQGALTVTERTVRVTATLGLALRPLRRRIEREIAAHLDSYTAAPG